MAIAQRPLRVLAFYSTSAVNTSYFPLTKWHGFTFTIVHSAVQTGCCPTDPHPIKKKKVMKHRNITAISPKGAKCLLGQAWIAEIGIPSSRPQRLFTELVMSCVGHSPNTHPKNHNDSVHFNYIDKSHESNSTLHLFSQWDGHGHVNFLWKAEVGNFFTSWIWKTTSKPDIRAIQEKGVHTITINSFYKLLTIFFNYFLLFLLFYLRMY